MEIIASHNNTDLDGLASMMAAKKLYPDAQLVFVGKLSRQCQEFMSLHKDVFNIRRAEDIPFERVSKLILVDTKDFRRIGALCKLITDYDIEVHVFDHHPRQSEDIPAHMEVVDEVGAATTLLVEMIIERNIAISSFEATVFALGIYSDTGNLTFSLTTSRDAAVVAYLLAQGARLSVISDFTGRALSEEQKNLLNVLLMSASHYLINGVKILITKASIDEFVAGLGLLTHKLGDIEGVDLIISVVHMEDRIHVVGRSRSDAVNVKSILQELGGGGHEKAASATIKGANLDEVIQKIEAFLKEKIKPFVTAESIMSAPVKTVYPNTTMEEAGKVMLRYGHSGLPVVDGLEMVGVISRRDVDKALQHNLGHAPVKGYMSRNVITTAVDTPLSEIQQTMIKNNIGRLPVVRHARLVGIVSRSDVLKTLHGESYPEQHQKVYSQQCSLNQVQSVEDLFNDRIPQKVEKLLKIISVFAEDKQTRVYIVGGFVRDILLNVKNLDIDLVVEGNGVTFARELAVFLGAKVIVHEKFCSAVLIFEEDFKIDVATSRVEYYEYPAALPQIESSSLQHDLYRRDFTINAMAISLNKSNYGKLMDYFCSREDLEKGVIRVLHNLSFVEDPTRILRAIRFEQRYNFTIEPQTLELAKSAIRENWLSKLSFERVREEIKHIFNESYPINAISRMRDLGLWKLILPEVNVDSEITRIIDRLPGVAESLQQKLLPGTSFQPWLVYLITMLHKLELEPANKIIKRFKLSKKELTIITNTLDQIPIIKDVLTAEEYLKQSVIVKTLESLSFEALAFLLAKSQKLRVIERINLYLQIEGNIKPNLDGDDLLSLGIKPGPIYAHILEAIRDAKLDGFLDTKDEELLFAKEFAIGKEEK